ncbi:MAG: alpha-galactosidase [Oscillospiraceae bacterium]|nr:alpha-galactosidase [Oscillospiraceae bacterium]
MFKIAIIGAGSIVFCSTFLNDIFNVPELNGCEIALMDPNIDKANKVKNYADKLILENGLKTKVYATSDRKDSLKNAKYVICTFLIGGIGAFGHDYEIPLRYGVDQCIADSIGPGGIFRLLRTAPVYDSINKDINELCPDAYVLNYVNPMGALCTYLSRYTSLKYVGLCHGVQTTMDLISGYVDVPKEDIDFVAAGINHMAWFLELTHNGKDLYPKLKQNMEKPEFYVNEKVRGELMRQCGYFMTESSGHLSEYLPWFRKNKLSLDAYCDMPDFGGESGAAYHFTKNISEKYADADVFELESGKLESRSKEYCSYIIEAIETGVPFLFNGNVANDELFISNLPGDSCVEVPIYADKQGLHPLSVGKLPNHLAAMNLSNITVQSLAAQAAYEADPEMVFWAISMDPLTSAVLNLDQIRAMTAEMFDAQRQWLPQFDGKTLKKTPTINIPGDVNPVNVPLDPALAINMRFGKL